MSEAARIVALREKRIADQEVLINELRAGAKEEEKSWLEAMDAHKATISELAAQEEIIKGLRKELEAVSPQPKPRVRDYAFGSDVWPELRPRSPYSMGELGEVLGKIMGKYKDYCRDGHSYAPWKINHPVDPCTRCGHIPKTEKCGHRHGEYGCRVDVCLYGGDTLERPRLREELADVRAAMKFFIRANDLPEEWIADRAERKVRLFRDWHDDAKEQP